MSWADLDDNKCPCKGEGWAEVDVGTWKECPIHYDGQIHPDTRTLLLDEPGKLAEEERRCRLRYQITQERDAIYDLHIQIKERQAKIVKLEFELINRTPTVRAMPAVRLPSGAIPSNPDLDLDWGDIFEETP